MTKAASPVNNLAGAQENLTNFWRAVWDEFRNYLSLGPPEKPERDS
jgi:hypothetical protein